jgi:predicted small lipoprotein YifL
MKVSKIPKCYAFMLALAVAMMLAMVVITGGCGKKGPPEPPAGSRPPRVKDLGYDLNKNTLKLSWTLPPLDEKAQLPITGFFIYRAQQPLSEEECPNCPIMFKIIGDVPVREWGSGQPLITFTDSIEAGYRYTYKVIAYSADGIRSRNSNFVVFTF